MSNDAASLELLLQQAEQAAQQFGASRSRLNTQAHDEYLARTDPDHVTESLNQVYLLESSALNRNLGRLQALSLALNYVAS
jgi:hypothetical protein